MHTNLHTNLHTNFVELLKIKAFGRFKTGFEPPAGHQKAALEPQWFEGCFLCIFKGLRVLRFLKDEMRFRFLGAQNT